jgi:hypothetical protein
MNLYRWTQAQLSLKSAVMQSMMAAIPATPQPECAQQPEVRIH